MVAIDAARPIVRGFVQASPAVRKDTVVAGLKELHGISEDTTVAILAEFIEAGLMEEDKFSISLIEQEHYILNWSFHIGKYHFRIRIGKKR